MNAHRNALILAGTITLLAGGARAEITTRFDLNGDGVKESRYFNRVGDAIDGSMKVFYWDVLNGDRDRGYTFALDNLGFSGSIHKSPGADKHSIVSVQQVSYLAAAERRGTLQWTPIGGGAAIDGKTRFYVPHVDNKVIESGEVYARAYGGTAREDAYPSIQLEFASAVASGTITHEVVNHSAVKLTFDWGATGMRGGDQARRDAPRDAQRADRRRRAEVERGVPDQCRGARAHHDQLTHQHPCAGAAGAGAGDAGGRGPGRDCGDASAALTGRGCGLV
jgi:hypothetical protein